MKRRRILKISAIVYLLCGVAYLLSVEMRPHGVVSTMNIIGPGVAFPYRIVAAAWALWNIALGPLLLFWEFKWR